MPSTQRQRDGDRCGPEKPPESSAELKEFYQAYGDSYVVSCATGGEYIGIYTFYCEMVEEQQQVAVAMEMVGIFKAFARDAGLRTKINDFHSSQNTRISFDQLITGKAGCLPDSDGVLDFALDFPSLPLTAPVVTSIKTRGYEREPGIGSRFNTIARNVQQLMQPDFVANLSRVS
ncbi:hypothetical protein L7F22_012876 [Adiantum nelumboides]|nr:hypothetical protein [Adiantum nelumboides]